MLYTLSHSHAYAWKWNWTFTYFSWFVDNPSTATANARAFTILHTYGFAWDAAWSAESLLQFVIGGRWIRCNSHDSWLTWLQLRQATLNAHTCNKCIGDDTKAAARQIPNYIKKIKYNEIWRKPIINGTWNSYTLQCGTMTLISPGDHRARWHVALGSWQWIEFTKWQ